MRRIYIALGALALTLGGCKTAAIVETKEIQTQRTGDLTIALLSEKGEFAMGTGILLHRRVPSAPPTTSLWTLLVR